MIRNIFMFMCCVLMISSCAHSPKKNRVMGETSSVSGVVLDEPVLFEGGNLGLTPFKAGPSAEATEELDRLSGTITKGIKDTIDEQSTSLHVIDATQGEPKMVLEGYVKEFSKTGRMSRMMMSPNRDKLSLEGDVWLVSNGKRLLGFSIEKKFDPRKEKILDVAYMMGREIGHFIISNSQKAKQ